MRVVPPGTRAHLIPIETRPRLYPFRVAVNRPVVRNGKPVRDEGRIYRPDDPGGVGRETVREALACPDCAAEESTAPIGRRHRPTRRGSRHQ
jgi:hypothetical protein